MLVTTEVCDRRLSWKGMLIWKVEHGSNLSRGVQATPRARAVHDVACEDLKRPNMEPYLILTKA